MKSIGMLAASLLTLQILGLPAEAMTDGPIDPGMRYKIVDVAKGDSLNVRSFPGTEGDILQKLEPDARGLVLTGVVSMVGDSTWAEIIVPGKPEPGYVNIKYLDLDESVADRETDFPVACSGTEPFWSVTVKDGKAAINDVDGDSTADAGTYMLTGPNTRSFSIPLSPTGSIAVIVTDEAMCSPGMGDAMYPWHGLMVTPKGYSFAGCCSRAAGG